MKSAELNLSKSKSRVKRVSLTVLIVILVAVSSSASTQAAKFSTAQDFDGSMFTTWFATMFNLMIFPVYIIVHCVFKLKPRGLRKLFEHCMEVYKTAKGNNLALKYFGISFLFSFMWVMANWSYIKSLSYLSTADVSAIFSSSNVLIFLLSLVILKEKFYIIKLFAVFLATAGVILFAVAEKLQFKIVSAILLVLFSALSASLYKVLFKKLIKSGSSAQVCFILTNIGVFVTFLSWLPVLIFHLTGFEALPANSKQYNWLSMFLRATFALFMNFSINYGIAYTNAVIISVGSLLAIVFNATIDFIIKKHGLVPLKIGGTFAIVVSFFLVVIPDIYLDKVETWRKPKETQRDLSIHNMESNRKSYGKD